MIMYLSLPQQERHEIEMKQVKSSLTSRNRWLLGSVLLLIIYESTLVTRYFTEHGETELQKYSLGPRVSWPRSWRDARKTIRGGAGHRKLSWPGPLT